MAKVKVKVGVENGACACGYGKFGYYATFRAGNQDFHIMPISVEGQDEEPRETAEFIAKALLSALERMVRDGAEFTNEIVRPDGD